MKMTRQLVKQQYEVVISLKDLGRVDNTLLTQIEIHHAWQRARISNMPDNQTKTGNVGHIQFYVPVNEFDESLMEDIAISVIGKRQYGGIEYELKK